MGILYLVDRPRNVLFDVTQWRKGQGWVVKLNPDRSLWRTVILHWVFSERTNYPCRGRDCKLCHLSSKICTYCPSLAWPIKPNDFDSRINGPLRPVVLVVNDGLKGILDADLEKVYLTRRVGQKDNSPVKAFPYDLGMPSPRVPSFDIVPTLEKIWGSQGEKVTAINGGVLS
jgi:hypothetical protein